MEESDEGDGSLSDVQFTKAYARIYHTHLISIWVISKEKKKERQEQVDELACYFSWKLT